MNQEAQPRKQQESQDSMEETSEPNPMTATASAATEETSEPTTASASASAATEETTLDARLTCFLEKDESFLTPWCWDPNAPENEASSSSTQEKPPLQFQPGSFFDSQIFDGRSESNPRENNDSQAESSNASRTSHSQPREPPSREPLNAFPPMSLWKTKCSHKTCAFRRHHHHD